MHTFIQPLHYGLDVIQGQSPFQVLKGISSGMMVSYTNRSLLARLILFLCPILLFLCKATINFINDYLDRSASST